MALIQQLPSILATDPDVNLLQTKWQGPLNTLLAQPSNNANILKNVKLNAGLNVINHGLGCVLTGWEVVRTRGAATGLTPGTYPLSLTSPWVASFPGSYGTPSYTVDGFGRVSLVGLLTTNASVVTPSGANDAIATLPTTLAPAYELIFLCWGSSTTGSVTVFRVDVSTNGGIYLIQFSAQSGITAMPASSAIQFLGLEPISFVASGAAIAPSFGDLQDTNPYPDKTLYLVASAAATVDLLVF